MTTTGNLRSLLGITQEEASYLLGVSRSQFSLFELGMRDLPAETMLTFVEMWSFLQNHKTIAEEKFNTEADNEKLEAFIKTEIIKVEYKQRLLEKKLLATEEKYQMAQSTLNLVDYLKNKNNPAHKNLISVIENNALKKIKKYDFLAQIKLQLKLKNITDYYEQLQALQKSIAIPKK